jgi:hypothetical protein
MNICIIYIHTLLNLKTKCWKHNINTSNAHNLKIIVIVVHERTMKAHRKNKREWNLDYHWICGHLNFTPCLITMYLLLFKKIIHPPSWPNFGYWCYVSFTVKIKIFKFIRMILKSLENMFINLYSPTTCLFSPILILKDAMDSMFMMWFKCNDLMRAQMVYSQLLPFYKAQSLGFNIFYP